MGEYFLGSANGLPGVRRSTRSPKYVLGGVLDDETLEVSLTSGECGSNEIASEAGQPQNESGDGAKAAAVGVRLLQKNCN